MKKSIIFYIFILITSCSNNESLKRGSYFDFKSLFTQQIFDLTQNKPVFVKTVDLNGTIETKDFNTINWAKELDPFVQSDINKPAFAQSYDIIETDSTLKYLLKSGEKMPIFSIMMKKKRNENQITYLEIENKAENFLYKWEKTLIAIFEKGKLKYYSVKGEQKILIFDAEKFHIIGQRK